MRFDGAETNTGILTSPGRKELKDVFWRSCYLQCTLLGKVDKTLEEKKLDEGHEC